MALTLLPGIYVQTAPPPVTEALPRMDIAAFVGMASSGPLHVPVMVEGIAQFENIFGSDYTLAWEGATGGAATAQLAPSVRSFFRNGGARCWAVRVAASSAVTNSFTVPGLYSWDGASLKAAKATARCAGGWSDELAIETALEQTPLAVAGIAADAVSKRLQITMKPGQQVRFSAGDTIQIRTLQNQFGFLVLGADLAAAEALWFEQAADQSWGTATVPVLWKDGYLASVVTFRMKVRGAGTLAMELTGLGLAPAHPRCWAWLPGDTEMFEIQDRPTAPAAPGLWSDAANPRFPIAGVARDTLYLPLGMPDFYTDGLATLSDPRPVGETSLERDGLANLSADLFIDSDLAGSTVENLLDQAFYTRFQSPAARRLTGMHALLEIDEVSLIAIPDAAQRSFKRTSYTAAILEAPVLSGGPAFEWTSVAGAQKYLLDSYGSTLYEGPDTHFSWDPGAPPCPATNCFRVRAENDSGYGPWSNTVVLSWPEELFAACDAKALPSPALKLKAELPLLVLSWDTADADFFEIQQSSDPGMAIAATVFSGSVAAPSVSIWAPATGTNYFRMRSNRGGMYSVWSNTVIYSAAPNFAWETDPADAVDARSSNIFAALIVFCAARSDMFAVLHTPAGFEPDQALAYKNELLAQFEGDSRSPSFAALYYPWTFNADAQSGVSVLQAPDGAIAGTYAARTLKSGAWYSPANIPLTEAVALEDEAAGAQVVSTAAQLFTAQVNLIRQQPRGFAAMSAETLTDDPDFVEANVRRLMILLRRLALREGVKDVFEPNDTAFQRRVQRHFDDVLGDLFKRGAFAGATAGQSFRVVTDQSVNTQQSLEAGRFIVELRVAPSEPLNFLIVRLMQTGSQVLLSEESAGGR